MTNDVTHKVATKVTIVKVDDTAMRLDTSLPPRMSLETLSWGF